MPIYEYQCQSCGHEHEALQKLSAEPLVICPACS
ncbi:MAG: FmdB family zinc ribbon protein, partial [Methylococcaceae bacterium]